MKKVNIANNYLLPKQIKNNGVKKEELNIIEGSVQEIIRSYTKESGVRKFRKRDIKNCEKDSQKKL